jgi:hypothetical protein
VRGLKFAGYIEAGAALDMIIAWECWMPIERKSGESMTPVTETSNTALFLQGAQPVAAERVVTAAGPAADAFGRGYCFSEDGLLRPGGDLFQVLVG